LAGYLILWITIGSGFPDYFRIRGSWVLGFKKESESKNLGFWVFQNPQRIHSSHERTGS
jgi:hypothetical protein